MLEDSFENEYISCKVFRYNINISIECIIKEEILDNTVFYYASNTPDKLTNFSGSGLPFPNKEIAFQGSSNIGRILIKTNEKKFMLKLLRPNSYYNENYVIVEPEVIIKYILKDGQTRVLNIPIDNKIPYRYLLMNYDILEKTSIIETQEKQLLKKKYPNILI
jgi:hypothetical protein